MRLKTSRIKLLNFRELLQRFPLSLRNWGLRRKQYKPINSLPTKLFYNIKKETGAVLLLSLALEQLTFVIYIVNVRGIAATLLAHTCNPSYLGG
jgi:hypothetical protein